MTDNSDRLGIASVWAACLLAPGLLFGQLMLSWIPLNERAKALGYLGAGIALLALMSLAMGAISLLRNRSGGVWRWAAIVGSLLYLSAVIFPWVLIH